jgi:hypothetical protein
MGIGLIVVASPAHAADLTLALAGSWLVGRVT